MSLVLNEVTGIATIDQEAILGENEIAAAALDHRGRAVGAIGVVGQSERLRLPSPSAELVTAVKDAARGLSREMGAARFTAIGE